MLKLVLPKGSLERATLALFEAADLPVKRGSERDYHGAIDDPRVERVSLLRPQEIPRYVEEGFFDLGITGRDWIEETGSKVVSLAELPYSKQTSNPVRVVLAVHRDLGVTRPEDLQPGLRVSTEFPNLTRRYFAELGLPARIFPSYGATEAKVPEIVDAVVDLTETGSTLRSHGMVVIATLLTSWTEVVANPASAADPERRQAMDDLLTLLVGAATARSKVLIKLNVADADLARVLAVLPSMKAPTVNELADSGLPRRRDGGRQGRGQPAHPHPQGRRGVRHPRAPHLQDRRLTRPVRADLTCACAQVGVAVQSARPGRHASANGVEAAGVDRREARCLKAPSSGSATRRATASSPATAATTSSSTSRPSRATATRPSTRARPSSSRSPTGPRAHRPRTCGRLRKEQEQDGPSVR